MPWLARNAARVAGLLRMLAVTTSAWRSLKLRSLEEAVLSSVPRSSYLMQYIEDISGLTFGCNILRFEVLQILSLNWKAFEDSPGFPI